MRALGRHQGITVQSLSVFLYCFLLRRFGLENDMPVGVQQTGHHVVYIGDLPYGDPVLRAISPSGSFSTGYSPDESTPAENDLSTTEFMCRVDTMRCFHVAQEAEIASEQSPLLPPLKDSDEQDEKGE
jgi:hypothetical protein